MDLSCNARKHQNTQKLQQQNHTPSTKRCMSVDDEDNLSNTSHSSSNFMHVTASDSESGTPISVRDMIKRYNSAAKTGAKLNAARRQPPNTLAAAKSSYFGVNKFGSQTNVRQFPVQNTLPEEPKSGDSSVNGSFHNSNNNNNNSNNSCNSSCYNNNLNNACHKKTPGDCSCPSRRSCSSGNDSDRVFIADHTRRSTRSPNMEDNELPENPSNLHTVCSRERNNLVSTTDIEDPNYQPMESSYQSKTTIAKTASGVRIIIDIFFDQEQQNMTATDVVGSRVETDIPQSRILSEFQQQASTQLARN